MPPPSAPSSPQLPAGWQLGDYRIESLLGSGGMADVYYAIDLQLDRPVALKILHSKFADDQIYLQRFSQEAKAAAALVHPNIVQIYGVGQVGKFRYIAQEFIPGTNLRALLDHQASTSHPGNHPLGISESLSILLQVLAALSKSSSAGIVHRDIKPENIMLTHEGDVKVADFGLARWSASEDPRLTNSGTTLGTPMYMSPEQIQGNEVDVRSDLYSLGATLFHILYGKPPFQGETPLALAMQHVHAKLPEVSRLRDDVPHSLEGLIQRLLSKSPDDRFENPQAVVAYLNEHRHHDLARDWPERTIPLPGVSQTTHAVSRATQKLQTLLRKQPKLSRLRTLGFLALVLAWLGSVFYITASVIGQRIPPVGKLLQFGGAEVFEGIPRQADAKSQYEWALFDRSASRTTKWEAIEKYFPRSSNPLNRLYVGLAKLQLARVYQDGGDLERATKQIATITNDSQMLQLVQAYAWLQQASIEHRRGDQAAIQAAVYQALRLRESLAKNRKDIEQLDRAIRAMPPDIELYWTP